MIRASLMFVALTALTVTACGGAAEREEESASSEEEIRVVRSFVSRGTAYYPDASPLEGGFVDRRGAKLRTLQQFLAGNATYVSVAMDTNAFPYGQRLRIRELEAKYGRPIVFRVVDTGGAFRGKGTTRIDVCVANRAASLDATINGTLHIDAIDERGGSADDATPAPSPPPVSASSSSCRSDGDCNPGNDGSGTMCSAGRCVPGCRANWMCPGSTMCVSGRCR